MKYAVGLHMNLCVLDYDYTKPIECAGRLFSDKEFLPFLVLLQHCSVVFYVSMVVLYVGKFSVGPCAVF